MEHRTFVTLVIVAGLLGGLGAWLWAILVGPAPLISDPVLSVPGYVALGGIAGFLGVFLVAKTDPTARMHAFAFSLACGVFWGPALTGAKAIVERAQVQQVAAQLEIREAEVKQLENAVESKRVAVVEKIEALKDESFRAAEIARKLDRAVTSCASDDCSDGMSDLDPRRAREAVEVLTETTDWAAAATRSLEAPKGRPAIPELDATSPRLE